MSEDDKLICPVIGMIVETESEAVLVRAAFDTVVQSLHEQGVKFLMHRAPTLGRFDDDDNDDRWKVTMRLSFEDTDRFIVAKMSRTDLFTEILNDAVGAPSPVNYLFRIAAGEKCDDAVRDVAEDFGATILEVKQLADVMSTEDVYEVIQI